jgi:hypothetical protein
MGVGMARRSSLPAGFSRELAPPMPLLPQRAVEKSLSVLNLPAKTFVFSLIMMF